MQKELVDLLVFIEIYSQENAINTFANVNDPVHFFEKYFDWNCCTKNLIRFKIEVQITSI